jgi:hypothetical protein
MSCVAVRIFDFAQSAQTQRSIRLEGGGSRFDAIIGIWVKWRLERYASRGPAKFFSRKISSHSADFFARREKSLLHKEAKIIFPDALRAKKRFRNRPPRAPSTFRRR